MRKTNPKKPLTLNTETLRQLKEADLDRAAGAGITQVSCAHSCATDCCRV